jgi:hypothetical protein
MSSTIMYHCPANREHNINFFHKSPAGDAVLYQVEMDSMAKKLAMQNKRTHDFNNRWSTSNAKHARKFADRQQTRAPALG